MGDGEQTGQNISMEALEKKFVQKEVCSLTRDTVNEMKVDVRGMKETMASMAEWMKIHHETHTGGWKKTHTLAVVSSTVIAAVSLLTTSILVIYTILH